MIVADTSVWIDYLNDRQTPGVDTLVSLLALEADVGVTDVVLTEVLQGARSDLAARRIEEQLRALPVLRLRGLDDFVLAADLYRTARRAGITIRSVADCLIAAPCVRTGATLLHADADFDRLASCTSLEVMR